MKTLSSLLIVLFSLAACGKEPSAGSGSTTEPLRVGVEAKYPPFESTKADGTFEGFDIDLARALADSLGRPAEFHNMDWDSLIPELQAGRVDLICSGMSYTDERAKVVDFSKPYAQSPMSVLVSTTRAKDVTKVSQLNEPTMHVAVQRGTTGETKARAAFPKATFMLYGDETAAATEVATGRVHAFVYDYLSVDKYAKQYPKETRVLDESIGSEKYCMVVAKGSPLLPKIDAFLDAAVKPGGKLDELIQKWIPGAEKLRPDAK
jgi:ABC-type amino acid transport substrate-binding protein